MYKVDFEKPIHVYFMGIGGISMSGGKGKLLGVLFRDFIAGELYRIRFRYEGI